METKRKGDWFQTFTGRAFWLMDPQPEEVCIEDIAHALALQCRYNGHTRVFYSVAQHSVLASQIVPEVDALWGLMHDAAEAYLGDMVRPLKLSMPEYREAEARIMLAVVARFMLPMNEPGSVRHADRVLLATERRDLMAPPPRLWDSIENVEPLPGLIVPWSPSDAEDGFLERFRELTQDSIHKGS